MAQRSGGSSPLDELRKVNEKVASSKQAANNASGGTQAPKPSAGITKIKNAAGISGTTAKGAAPKEEVNADANVQVHSSPSEEAANVARAAGGARARTAESTSARPAAPKAPARTPSQATPAATDAPKVSATATRVASQAKTDRRDMSGTMEYSRDKMSAYTRVSPAVSGRPRSEAPKGSVARPTNTAGRTVPKKDNDKEKSKDYTEVFEETVGRGVVSSAMKAVIYIVCVLVISGCLSLITVFVANDVFAFVKSGDECTVTIAEDASLGDIAKTLHKNDIIKYPSIFKLYCNLRHKTADDYRSGEFTLAPSMGYDQLIAEFLPESNVRKELTVTIIEGMYVDEIIDLFLENGIGEREKFVDVIQNYDFDYWFVDDLDVMLSKNPNSGRKYRLEGYLFPDTYNFYSNASEVDVIDKLLDNFDKKFDQNKRMQAEAMGYTADQIITIASMVQKEAKFVSDYPNVASVFFNRINDGMRLQSNATVQYTMPKEEVELKLTYAQIEKYDTPYNTYLHDGLPVGPICNPSLNAFNWALNPADTNYYYFVSDSEGYNLYARTNAEHERNCAEVEAQTGE